MTAGSERPQLSQVCVGHRVLVFPRGVEREVRQRWSYFLLVTAGACPHYQCWVLGTKELQLWSLLSAGTRVVFLGVNCKEM